MVIRNTLTFPVRICVPEIIPPLWGEAFHMSIGTSLTLSKDSATDVDTNTVVYDLLAADSGRSDFSVAGITPPSTKTANIGHQVGKSGEARHKVGLDRTEIDAFGVAATLSTYIVQVRPPSSALTNAICIEEVNRLVDFIIEGGSNANWTKVLNNEV
jgi:hypothetical protein